MENEMLQMQTVASKQYFSSARSHLLLLLPGKFKAAQARKDQYCMVLLNNI